MGIARARWLLALRTRQASASVFGPAHESRTAVQTVRTGASNYFTAKHINVARCDEDGLDPTLDVTRSTLSSLLQDVGKSRSLGACALELNFLASNLGQDGNIYLRQRREADVSNMELLGRLAIDQPEHIHSLEAWTDLLRFRYRIDGVGGVRDVWKGMRMRHFELPVQGAEAEFFWTTFLQSTITSDSTQAKCQRSAEELVTHATDVYSKRGQLTDVVYQTLVGGWFQVDTDKAKEWHERLRARGLAPANALKLLSGDIISVCMGSNVRIAAFLDLSRSKQDRHLYDHVIPQVLDRCTLEAALLWHQALLKRGDAPSREVFQNANVQVLFDLDRDLSLPIVRRTRLDPSTDELPKPSDFPRLTRSLMSTLVGDVHGIKEKSISDGFIARLLATRAINIDVIIRAISVLGVDHLDAVGTRELALRCRDTNEYLQYTTALRAQGVDVGQSSRFADMLWAFATEGNVELFNALVRSDQHPENFEKFELQARLMKTYSKLAQHAEEAIAYEALVRMGQRGKRAAWNLGIQRALQARQWKKLSRYLEDLQANHLAITSASLDLMDKYVAGSSVKPERQEPSVCLAEGLDIITNAYFYADDRQGHMRPAAWASLLKRHARLRNWTQIEKLVVHLAGRYRQARMKEVLDPRDRTTAFVGSAFYLHAALSGRRHPGRWRSSNVYAAVFTAQMLGAIFVWGHRAAMAKLQKESMSSFEDAANTSTSSNTSDGINDRSQGLVLLRQIQNMGISVPTKVVRLAIVDFLWTIFGPGRSVYASNRELQRYTTDELARFIDHANKIWDGQLFPDLDLRTTDLNDPQAKAKFLVYIFGHKRRVDSKRQDYFDVEAWARLLESAPTDLVSTLMPLPVDKTLHHRLRVHTAHSPKTRKVVRQSLRSTSIKVELHQSPFARSSSSHLPPNLSDTPGPD